MNALLKKQLRQVYGEDFNLDEKDENFLNLLKLVGDSYEKYESVENSLDNAIFYKDLKHRYMGCNKKFQEFFGLQEDDIIGKTDYDFFDNETAMGYCNINNEIIKNKTKITYKHWVNYDGEKTYVLTSKTPLIDANGKVIGTLGSARDITHEYELQKKLEQKNIMLIQQNKLVSMGEMIANIAHQWRQPLNTLGLLVQKMGLFYKHGELKEYDIDTYISKSMLLITEMSETIDDFRNFFSKNRVLENFDVKEAILKSLLIINPVIKANHINCKICENTRCFVSGYKNEFFQVILNLLNNAAEALLEAKIQKPTIRIFIKETKEHVLIEVSDNGNGISSTHIGKIFEPYFTTKDNGTGLGLYMSKIIIEEHMHGKLSVSNSIFGTTFQIKLQKVQKLV